MKYRIYDKTAKEYVKVRLNDIVRTRAIYRDTFTLDECANYIANYNSICKKNKLRIHEFKIEEYKKCKK